MNQTEVAQVIAPNSTVEAQQAVNKVRDAGQSLSIAAGRHAMGGQQFLSGGTLLDTRNLNRIVGLDAERGIVTVEAGIMWSDLICGLRTMQAGADRRWSVVQKQTGADRLSVGGALAANGHGRGLTYRPIVQDVDSCEMIDADGNLTRCDREQNSDLFRLAIGGYGLFGVITTVDLRLMPAHHVHRVVEVTTIDKLVELFKQRIADGFTYGDFQYRTDENSPGFLRDGVLSCYRPVSDGDARNAAPPQYLLNESAWRQLLYWSHADKDRAFEEYAGFYRSTHGQIYDSDTFQLSQYIDHYHQELDERLGCPVPGSETITELYVPLPELPGFMAAAGAELRRQKANVIYGTIRLIERDDETMLNWARQPYACIVVNLHMDQDPEGIQRVAHALRTLIDLAIERDGSYFLTYNRFATPDQLATCYPQFSEFVSCKKQYDPHNVFSSDWFRAYADNS
ncbi:MAG: FAD-binding oxidoreductase [Chloroflexota bacterium]|nr:FAD-binding oxidoreductase [Chloroflexota bacterium]MDE2958771.1 FAD-binding oxidoreductase [Chloroflexota bacterium]